MNQNKKIGYILCEAGTATVSEVDLVEKGRRVVAEGRLQTAGEVNRNKRIYERPELAREITCARTKELLSAGYMRAESGHPMSKDLARQQTIDPSNTCALFKTMGMKGDDVIATFCGTNNALGEAFDLDLRDGYKPAWSLRALGSVEQTAKGACVRNLRMITYDHVIYPSHPGAYTTGIVSESGDLLSESNLPTHTLNLVGETPDGMKLESTIITPITNTEVLDYIKKESTNFKRIQESFELLYDNIVLVENGRTIQMTDRDGDTICVNLENYIHNKIMNYFW